MTLRHTIGRYVPHTVRALLNDLGPHGYSGRFPTYDAARERAASTDEPDAMIERTAAATAAVRDGKAEYEQDSLLMTPPAAVSRLRDAIAAVAAKNGGRAHVVDFGGGLGSKYFWARRALSSVVTLRWTVVELDRHVDYGRAHFATSGLTFERTLADVIPPIDVVACDSALQYLPDAIAGVAAIGATGAQAIVLDRLPYATSGRAEVTLQRIDGRIYSATLASWLLDERAVVGTLEAAGYRLAERFEYPRVYSRRAVFAGHVFARLTETIRS
jgi:putative methyltransferase (TIGR04325 family)